MQMGACTSRKGVYDLQTQMGKAPASAVNRQTRHVVSSRNTKVTQDTRCGTGGVQFTSETRGIKPEDRIQLQSAQ